MRSIILAMAVLLIVSSQAHARNRAPTAPSADMVTAKAEVDRIYRELPGSGTKHVRYGATLQSLLDEDARRANGEAGFIDADPFCNCQDTDLNYSFTSTARRVRPGVVEVTVALRNGKPETYRIDMERTPAGWAVADIHSAWQRSLVAYLRRSLGPAAGR